MMKIQESDLRRGFSFVAPSGALYVVQGKNGKDIILERFRGELNYMVTLPVNAIVSVLNHPSLTTNN